jgi:integrase
MRLPEGGGYRIGSVPMASHASEQPAGRLQMHCDQPGPQATKRGYVRGSCPESRLFTTEIGEPIRRTAFSERVWRPAVKRAGLSGVTMHALRHFYASLLIRHGESVKTVQARLGHASAAETLDTYRHLWPRLGRPDTCRGGRRARPSCGLCAD